MNSKQLSRRINEILDQEHFGDDEIEALLALGEPAAKILGNYATGSHPGGDPDLQARAILVCGASGYDSCQQPLEKVLTSPDEDMRLQAMLALGQLGSDSAFQRLQEMVSDEACSMLERSFSVQALADSGHAAAQTFLTQLENSYEASDEIGELLKEVVSIFK